MPRPKTRQRTTTAAKRPTPRPTAPASRPEARGGSDFAIVGIGASAGGLEALEQFLQNIPLKSGLAYVVVQHLDPTRKAIMVELLQHVTPMPVHQIRDGTRVRPDCVYVIPPNTDLGLLRGVLHLLEPAAARGSRLPIDFFFRSLALDQQERSVGVILSGMGTDGTLGLRAIKEHAGLVLVQEPTTAQFDSMPRSAIAAGVVDIVAPPPLLPGKLLSCLEHTPALRASAPAQTEANPSGLAKILLQLRTHTGHDFSQYRRSTLDRRIQRRMAVHQFGRLASYVRFLQENPQEVTILFKELLIGVTSFFRDPAAWDRLRDEFLPRLIAARKGSDHSLRAWVAGCSTGEEAYSLAMVFKEVLEQEKPGGRCTLQIYATDLDQDAIAKARQGVYPENIAADVSPARLSRFFTQEGPGFQVNKEIREMVIFAPQDLILDPPFTKLDLLSCRNLLIYLTPELQRRLIPLFHYSLVPGGVLLLGSAESIGDSGALFAALAPKERLFRRLEKAGRGLPVEFPSRAFAAAPRLPGLPEPLPPADDSLQSLADQELIKHHTPPAVLVNAEGDILYVSGRTGRFLEPAAGKANWNVVAMAREELRYELIGALQKAMREKQVVTVPGLPVQVDARTLSVDLVVRPFAAPAALRGTAMIIFAESATPAAAAPKRRGEKAPAGGSRVEELARALRSAQQELQAGREEMQSSQEELRSMNEELQSANEELQSTNEELSTSKEEMQSLNEELQTVNAELQSKLEELSGANNDMKNLLNSTEIATVFLDDALRVRRFTDQANQLFKLIPTDVGRPITDLATDLCYPELAADAREVLRTLVFAEKSVATRSGRWFAARILPYRTIENRIDGLVITFSDITTAKRLEAELREKCSELGQLHATSAALSGVAATRTASES